MNSSRNFKSGKHCVFDLHVHLVFVTKFRRPVLSDRILNELHNAFTSICEGFDAELIEFNGERDHVHLLVSYPPKMTISILVNRLKGISSRCIRKKNFPEIQNQLWGKSLWSPSYFAGSCGGAPISVIKKYIEQQTQTF